MLEPTTIIIPAHKLTTHLTSGETHVRVEDLPEPYRSAPDLLAALEDLYDVAQTLQAYIPSQSYSVRQETSEALVQARAAIAKAEEVKA